MKITYALLLATSFNVMASDDSERRGADHKMSINKHHADMKHELLGSQSAHDLGNASSINKEFHKRASIFSGLSDEEVRVNFEIFISELLNPALYEDYLPNLEYLKSIKVEDLPNVSGLFKNFSVNIRGEDGYDVIELRLAEVAADPVYGPLFEQMFHEAVVQKIHEYKDSAMLTSEDVIYESNGFNYEDHQSEDTGITAEHMLGEEGESVIYDYNEAYHQGSE